MDQPTHDKIVSFAELLRTLAEVRVDILDIEKEAEGRPNEQLVQRERV